MQVKIHGTKAWGRPMFGDQNPTEPERKRREKQNTALKF
jgi:hypothetical protein